MGPKIVQRARAVQGIASRLDLLKTMRPNALKYLACLNCGADLQLINGYSSHPNIPGEIYNGKLECISCGSQYDIVRGVPRMLDPSKSTPTDIRTGRSFAEAWKRFPLITETYEKQFYDWIFPVDSGFLKDKVILESGCGKGRHAKLVHDAGAKAIFAVDIGEAVDVAYANVGNLPNVTVVQADIAQLPFRNDFDFAFSLGVLHHMESPAVGFRSMSSKIKEGGSICVWVYGKENNGWLIWFVNPIRLLVTSKMPSQLLLFLCFFVALPLFVYCRFFVRPWQRLRRKHPRLPSLFYASYLEYIARFDFTEVHHIVFDHLIAPVAHYIARADVAGWFDHAGWPDCVIRWHNRNSWSAFSSQDLKVLESMRAKVKESTRPEIGGTTARSSKRSR